MTIHRYVVKSPVMDSIPLIALNLSAWLNQKYPTRPLDEGIDAVYWAYGQDMKECIAVLFSRNEVMLNGFISDLNLHLYPNDDDAIADSLGWKTADEPLGGIAEKVVSLDKINENEITECCKGCNQNKDGLAVPKVTPKPIPKPKVEEQPK